MKWEQRTDSEYRKETLKLKYRSDTKNNVGIDTVDIRIDPPTPNVNN